MAESVFFPVHTLRFVKPRAAFSWHRALSSSWWSWIWGKPQGGAALWKRNCAVPTHLSSCKWLSGLRGYLTLNCGLHNRSCEKRKPATDLWLLCISLWLEVFHCQCSAVAVGSPQTGWACYLPAPVWFWFLGNSFCPGAGHAVITAAFPGKLGLDGWDLGAKLLSIQCKIISS